MKCYECKHPDSKVIESRELDESTTIRRRRQCLGCNYRFTTYERVETPNVVVVKKDGRRELFSREKIATGVYRAVEKRPISVTEVERIISEVERYVRALGEQEISSSDIGEKVMIRLEGLDDVAYVRFASVYRRFASVDQFESELKRLRRDSV